MKSAVVYGGRSLEHDASLASFANVFRSIQGKAEFDVAVYIDREGNPRMDDSPRPREEGELQSLPTLTPSQVATALSGYWTLNLLHGQEGEDGTFAGWARVNQLHGSWGSTVGDAICMAKWASGPVAAAVMGDRGRVPNTLTVRTPGHVPPVPSGVPLIIKPGSSGASIQTFAVAEWSDECRHMIAGILSMTRSALVQERVFGTEYSAGVLELAGRPVALPVVRVQASDGFYDHAAKHQAGHASKAFEDSACTRLLQEIAVELFVGMDCFGMARMDFIVPDGEVPVFLETNTLPGLMSGSIFPAMLHHAGLNLADLLSALQEADALRREKELDVIYRYEIEEAH